MNGKRISWSLAACLTVVACWSAAANAAPPWAELLTLKRVEADPDTEYRVSEENGPWMIMACSFSGDEAQQQARNLVYELRKRYKLPAYSHQVRFQFGHTQGRGIDQYGAPLRMKHRLDNLEEVAVLVGNYASVDDPHAQKTLQKLKYMRPDCLEIEPDKPTARSLAGLRAIQKQILAPGSEKKQKGPMGHAFVTTNPSLSKEFFASSGIDPEVVKWNEGVEYSLLDCPGNYTVQVATFKGQTIIKQGEIQAIKRGKETRSKLADAAMKAHLLTEALRMKNWEAYEFHDRYASIVTVGSFNSAGSPRADGRIEINPAVHRIMQTFGAQRPNLPGMPPGTTDIKSLIGIPFDVQPILVHVPKRSISRELAGSM